MVGQSCLCWPLHDDHIGSSGLVVSSALSGAYMPSFSMVMQLSETPKMDAWMCLMHGWNASISHPLDEVASCHLIAQNAQNKGYSHDAIDALDIAMLSIDIKCISLMLDASLSLMSSMLLM